MAKVKINRICTQVVYLAILAAFVFFGLSSSSCKSCNKDNKDKDKGKNNHDIHIRADDVSSVVKPSDSDNGSNPTLPLTAGQLQDRLEKVSASVVRAQAQVKVIDDVWLKVVNGMNKTKEKRALDQDDMKKIAKVPWANVIKVVVEAAAKAKQEAQGATRLAAEIEGVELSDPQAKNVAAAICLEAMAARVVDALAARIAAVVTRKEACVMKDLTLSKLVSNENARLWILREYKSSLHVSGDIDQLFYALGKISEKEWAIIQEKVNSCQGRLKAQGLINEVAKAEATRVSASKAYDAMYIQFEKLAKEEANARAAASQSVLGLADAARVKAGGKGETPIYCIWSGYGAR